MLGMRWNPIQRWWQHFDGDSLAISSLDRDAPCQRRARDSDFILAKTFPYV